MRSAECGVRIDGEAGSHARRGNALDRSSASPLCRLLSILCILLAARAANSDDKLPAYTTETLRGHVVFLAAAFEKQTGIRSVPEAKDRILALQTTAGDLIPLLEDVRGRAFRRDKRLLEMQLELEVRRYRQSPLVQILRVYEIAKDGRYEIDYWCDVCAIALYENRECDCCQGPVALRRRKVD